jgi:hypothetical protein
VSAREGGPGRDAAQHRGAHDCRFRPRSEIRGEAFDLPVPVADGVGAVATLQLLRLLRGQAVALSTPGSGLGKRAFRSC